MVILGASCLNPDAHKFSKQSKNEAELTTKRGPQVEFSFPHAKLFYLKLKFFNRGVTISGRKNLKEEKKLCKKNVSSERTFVFGGQVENSHTERVTRGGVQNNWTP